MLKFGDICLSSRTIYPRSSERILTEKGPIAQGTELYGVETRRRLSKYYGGAHREL